MQRHSRSSTVPPRDAPGRRMISMSGLPHHPRASKRCGSVCGMRKSGRGTWSRGVAGSDAVRKRVADAHHLAVHGKVHLRGGAANEWCPHESKADLRDTRLSGNERRDETHRQRLLGQREAECMSRLTKSIPERDLPIFRHQAQPRLRQSNQKKMGSRVESGTGRKRSRIRGGRTRRKLKMEHSCSRHGPERFVNQHDEPKIADKEPRASGRAPGAGLKDRLAVSRSAG